MEIVHDFLKKSYNNNGKNLRNLLKFCTLYVFQVSSFFLFFVIFIFSFFLLFQRFLFMCVSFFLSFFFQKNHFLVIFHFSVVRADAKTRKKNRRTVPIVKMTIFLL